MEILKQSIPDVLLIKPNVYTDERGFFLETLRETWTLNLTNSKSLHVTPATLIIEIAVFKRQKTPVIKNLIYFIVI